MEMELAEVEEKPRMSDMIGKALHRLGLQLPGRLSLPGDDGYAAATSIWAKSTGPAPRAVAVCRTPQDVQTAIRAARECNLPLSVRGGGHDWAGRALCEGLVIDLRWMNRVDTYLENCTARVAGGARASDVLDATVPLEIAAAT